jgi:hypothetical protein
MTARFRPGDVVVYRKQKSSLHPGANARDIQPAADGDFYSYSVEKFWRVVAVRPDNALVVRTRKGKQHSRPRRAAGAAGTLETPVFLGVSSVFPPDALPHEGRKWRDKAARFTAPFTAKWLLMR